MRRFVLALLVIPLVAAACGGSKKSASMISADPATAVKDAAAKTAQAGSEHLAIVARVAARGQVITFKGTGDFDTKRHLGSLKGDFSAGGLNGSLEEVSSGTDAYVKSDLLSALVPGGKTWVKLDLVKAAKARGLNITSFLSQDPTQALTQLQSLTNVTKVAPQPIDGNTTHFRASIDLSKLNGAASKGTGRYDVWIGDDGYVHQVSTIVTTAGTTSTVTTDLSAFGESVNVAVPKPGDTYAAPNGTIPGLGG